MASLDKNIDKSTVEVLVIEDDQDSREAIVQLLKMEGYQPYEAPDGETGVNKAREVRPDLILLDLNLPDIDGRQIIQMLRGDQSLAKTPILVLTAAGRNEAQSAVEMGANAYFIKPLEYETLLRTLPMVRGSMPAGQSSVALQEVREIHSV